MEQSRVRIADIAQTLGLSAATVSNVIHGKTEKLSGETGAAGAGTDRIHPQHGRHPAGTQQFPDHRRGGERPLCAGIYAVFAGTGHPLP